MWNRVHILESVKGGKQFCRNISRSHEENFMQRAAKRYLHLDYRALRNLVRSLDKALRPSKCHTALTMHEFPHYVANQSELL
jgi:hypothetical protein